jgi:hypothetical protein
VREVEGNTPVVLDNGVEILGYDVSGEVSPGRDLRLALYWTVRAVPGASYHFFNHLVDDEGQRWGQKDGPGYPAGQWQEGDVIISWFDIPIAPDGPAQGILGADGDVYLSRGSPGLGAG